METELAKELLALAGPTTAPTSEQPTMARAHRPIGVSGQHEHESRGARSLRCLDDAEELESRPEYRQGDRYLNLADARRLRAESTELLKPDGTLVAAAGEAVIQPVTGSDPKSPEAFFRDTLTDPDSVSIHASTQRMNAALIVGVLHSAMDAAASAGAANSLEKMLCHQSAGAHQLTMKLLARVDESRLPPVEIARLANAAARMMDVYQSACLTLQKMKTKGTQRVVVQYQQVNVGTGGQAVVAGKVSRGSLRRGKGRDAK